MSLLPATILSAAHRTLLSLEGVVSGSCRISEVNESPAVPNFWMAIQPYTRCMYKLRHHHSLLDVLEGLLCQLRGYLPPILPESLELCQREPRGQVTYCLGVSYCIP